MSVASWGNRIDEMQTELREAARRVCKPEEIFGAVGLICHLGKSCFIQGLNSERIETIDAVKANQPCYHRRWRFLWKKSVQFFPIGKNPWPQGISSGVVFAIE